MPAIIPFIPLIAAGTGTAGSIYAANKMAGAAKPDAATQAAQEEALRAQIARNKLMEPIMARLAGGVNNRLPASYQAGGASPAMGQALSQVARGLPGPGAQPMGRARQRMM